MPPRILPIVVLAPFLSAVAVAHASPRARQGGPDTDQRIWPEFVSLRHATERGRLLRLYRQTSHMRELISEEDFRRIVETIWRDRATAAGWNVAFTYDGSRCTLRYGRKTGDVR